MRASHVCCVVDDLVDGVSTFEAAGFTVELGDRPGRAKNALVWFEEGPFIELLERGAGPPKVMATVLSRVAPGGMIQRFNRWAAQPEGWCEIALECDGDVKPLLEGFAVTIGKVAGPFSTKRTPPGGREIKTQTAFPHDPDVPMLMGEYRPDPRPASIEHANGAVSIESIVIDVPAKALEPISAVLDVDDPWIKLRASSPTSTVREVVLRGLDADIDPSLVCGAVIRSAHARS